MIAQLAAAAKAALEFQSSMQRLREAAAGAADGIARLRRSLVKLSAIVRAPLNYDPDDGSWQTDLCAAWLHAECPFPAVCDCTCHGGCRR